MDNKIVIIGHSASGKTYLYKKFISDGKRGCIKYTTRPIRYGEEDGEDYYFISNDEFKHMIENNKFLTYEYFEVDGELWYYGITEVDFNNSELIILTPYEINYINDIYQDNDFRVIFLDIDEDVRIERLSKRNDKDSVDRRINSDREDFQSEFIYHILINDHEFDYEDIIQSLKSL